MSRQTRLRPATGRGGRPFIYSWRLVRLLCPRIGFLYALQPGWRVLVLVTIFGHYSLPIRVSWVRLARKLFRVLLVPCLATRSITSWRQGETQGQRRFVGLCTSYRREPHFLACMCKRGGLELPFQDGQPTGTPIPKVKRHGAKPSLQNHVGWDYGRAAWQQGSQGSRDAHWLEARLKSYLIRDMARLRVDPKGFQPFSRLA